jgi:rod shape-determining protein MreC
MGSRTPRTILDILGVLLFLLAFGVWSPFPALKRITNSLTNPLIMAVKIPITGTGHMISQVFTLRQAQKENESLQDENQMLKAQLLFLAGSEKENERLRQALGFSHQPFVLARLINADLLARHPDTWFHRIEINKGESQGVAAGMVALTPDGVVGYVENVYPMSSTIKLLTDPEISVPSIDERTKELGLLSGEGKDTLVWRYIPADSDIQVGDLILTSSTSNIFPEGLRLGYVVESKIIPGELFKRVVVRPAIPFATLNSIILISTR